MTKTVLLRYLKRWTASCVTSTPCPVWGSRCPYPCWGGYHLCGQEGVPLSFSTSRQDLWHNWDSPSEQTENIAFTQRYASGKNISVLLIAHATVLMAYSHWLTPEPEPGQGLEPAQLETMGSWSLCNVKRSASYPTTPFFWSRFRSPGDRQLEYTITTSPLFYRMQESCFYPSATTEKWIRLAGLS